MLLNTRKKTRVKFNPGLSADRPSNNWAQFNEIRWKPYADVLPLPGVLSNVAGNEYPIFS